ncbi:hypothetical protein NQZ68_000663 [Dissostichus eleginoides]|nr:hypothetical protein NQZ68_000663 [Dissostichus eleginoides]
MVTAVLATHLTRDRLLMSSLLKGYTLAGSLDSAEDGFWLALNCHVSFTPHNARLQSFAWCDIVRAIGHVRWISASSEGLNFRATDRGTAGRGGPQNTKYISLQHTAWHREQGLLGMPMCSPDSRLALPPLIG